MLDQNTDRMWYVIGAVIIGAAIILILNGTAPELFASVGETFKGKTDEVTERVDRIGEPTKGVLLETDSAVPVNPNPNLLPNSGGDALHNVDLYYAADVVVEDGKKAIGFTNNDNIVHFYSSDVTLVDGETYTFSFYAQGERDTTLKNYIYINSKNYIKESKGQPVHGTPITTEWNRYSVTFIAKGNGNVGIHMYPIKANGNGDPDTFYLTEWKLEKGDTATPWVL